MVLSCEGRSRALAASAVLIVRHNRSSRKGTHATDDFISAMPNDTTLDKLRSLLLPGSTPFTTLMILFSVAFYGMLALQSGEAFQLPGFTLFRAGAAFAPFAIGGGEYWRWLTYALLHGGLIHLGFNVYALSVVGPLVERRFGSARTAAIFWVAAFLGGMASNLWTGTGMTVGASGGIMGLIGAGVVAAHQAGTSQAHSVRNQLLFWFGLTMLIGIVGSMGGARLDNAAHLGGFVAGCAFGFAATLQRRVPGAQRIAEGVVAVLLTVGSVGAVIAHQIVLRDVPPVNSGSRGAAEGIRRSTWEPCHRAIVEGALREAVAPCKAYRTVSFEYGTGYLILDRLYRELDQPERAERELALLRAVGGDQGDEIIARHEGMDLEALAAMTNAARFE